MTAADLRLSTDQLVASSHDDYSNTFARIRGRLVNREGVRLTDFVHQLKPVYWRIHLDIAIGYAALIATMALAAYGQAIGLSPIVLGALGAILVGYWVLYLASFVHEAAHWNLARTRKTNDLLSNLLLSWIVGLEIVFYRKVHFEHHRSLGTVHDTEFSYFSPLNPVFIAKSLLGIRVIQTLWSYRKSSDRAAASRQRKGEAPTGAASYVLQAAGVLMHVLIIGSLWWFGFTAAAAAWLFGMGAVFPLLGSVRQLLEHRTEEARPDVDYSATNQGACARIFGAGPFASTFGSAGFNRHLLHHWEPQVSYTRLRDLERFLADTPMRAVMDLRRVSYAETFRRLFSLY